jgi:hypothetical protein
MAGLDLRDSLTENREIGRAYTAATLIEAFRCHVSFSELYYHFVLNALTLLAVLLRLLLDARLHEGKKPAKY